MGHLLLLLYSLLAPVLAAFYAVFFLLSPRRALMKALGGEAAERLALSPKPAGARPVWLHAASVGEVKAVSRLAPELAAALKAPLLITASTASGRTEAARLTPHARLAPIDFYPLASRFIARTRPRLLAVVETEIWPATLFAAAGAGVPVYFVNARISPGTASLCRALAPLFRLAFRGVRKVLAQSEADAAAFRTLPGLEGKVEMSGNLKHDQLAASAAGQDKVKAFIEAAGWAGAPVFTAGSTHPAEEPVLISAWLQAKARRPDLKLVLVPRHTEKLQATLGALKQAGAACSLWSQGPAAGADCLVVDAMGLLQALYAASAVCFVGGTLDDTGGHNLLEPALFGRPVIFGPNFRNARLSGETLLKEKGGFLEETAEGIAARLSVMLSDPAFLKSAGAASGRALKSLQGATAKTLLALTGTRQPT